MTEYPHTIEDCIEQVLDRQSADPDDDAAKAARGTACLVDRLGQVLYEMGIDDLDLPDAQKLAAHIVTRLGADR